MATQPNILIEPNVWTSINNAAGVVVGTAMQVMNLSYSDCYIQENTTQPLDSNNDGQLLSGVDKDYAVGTIADGSDEVWVKPVNNSKIKIAVNV